MRCGDLAELHLVRRGDDCRTRIDHLLLNLRDRVFQLFSALDQPPAERSTGVIALANVIRHACGRIDLRRQPSNLDAQSLR